jgi:hypothetical protein
MGTAFLRGQRGESVLYTWDKYSVDKWEEAAGETHYINVYYTGWTYGKTYTFDKSTGLYSLTGTSYSITSGTSSSIFADSEENFLTNGSTIFALSLEYDGYGAGYFSVSVAEKSKTEVTHTQGTIDYGTVTSYDINTYPSPGEQDGYWYVRRG